MDHAWPPCPQRGGREHSHINVAELALLLQTSTRAAWGLVRDDLVGIGYPGNDGAVQICAESAIDFNNSELKGVLNDPSYPGDLGELEEWVDTRLQGCLSNEWFADFVPMPAFRVPAGLHKRRSRWPRIQPRLRQWRASVRFRGRRDA